MEIDLVYLWVDGNDPEWLKKKNQYLPEDRKSDLQAVGDCRFEQNDELLYSLRSVARYAPWIRRIYIVTDNQIPAWLNTSNPRIRIVDHREILPEETLPVFNSGTIELGLWRIPDLAEHFLYGNDDMFFNKPVTPDFFFDKKGRPIARLKKQSLRRHLDQIYPYNVYWMQQLIRTRFGKEYTLAPHHNIDAYRKSDYQDCYNYFQDEIAKTAHSRFRIRADFQRSAFLYYALAIGNATERPITRYNRLKNPLRKLLAMCGWGCATDSRCIPIETPNIGQVLKKYNPILFCLNDDERRSADSSKRMRDFLSAHFPEKSEFER